MDEEEAKTEFCSNCRRDIPAANFVMHVTHCQRNLTLCKECGEPVPTSQQEEHFEEYHAKEKCDCGQLVEKMNLEEHKEKDCPNRGVECQYCELTLPFNKMSSHVEYCGSRTEKCDICERFIQMKDLTEHVNTGCQYPPIKEESKKLPSNLPYDFLSEMPVGMLHAMGLMDSSVNGTDADYFHPFRAGMHEFGQIINTGLGTSPFSDPHMQYPGGAAYFGGISAGNGVIDGSDVIARGAKRSREFPKPEFDQRISRGFDKVDDDEYMQDIDDDEMLAAAYQADTFDIANGNVNRTSSAMVDETFPYMFMKSTLMADSVNDADKTQLPCEFCGDLFPVDTLIMHQSGCQLSSLDSIQSHSTFAMDRKFHTNHTEPGTKARKSSEDDTFLPCEFCQELFPFENLIAHQAVCDACPESRPPSELDGPAPRPLLNNARPQVRNGSTSRPSRPVYESKKSQKAITNYIPSELDDGDDLDFTPNVNDNPTTRDPSHKPEKYSDRHRGHDISLMNNELQRQDRRAANNQSMPGQAVLRNNDFANRQPNKDALRVKNRTAEQHMRRQPEAKVGAYSTSSKAPAAKPLQDEPAVFRNTNLTNHQSMPGQAVLRYNDRPALRTKQNRTGEQHMRGQPDPRVGKHVTSSKAPGAKTLENGQGQKNAGSRSKPAAELVKKPNRGRPIDSATRSQPRQPSMNDEMEPTRRGSGHKISHRSETKASKSRRPDNGGFQSDLSSASREVSSHNSRTKTRDPLPPISKPVSHNGSSSVFPVPNPRRNPPTAGPAENGIRNRSDSPTRRAIRSLPLSQGSRCQRERKSCN